MKLRIVGKTSASSDAKAAAQGALAANDADAVTVVAGPEYRHNATGNGSKDESFFEAKPWFDSDSEDDFYSVRGDFTPSRGSTPDHPRITFFSGRMPVDRSKPSLIQKKQRLLDLLQEKQYYDDEETSITDVSSELDDSTVHAEQHMTTFRRHQKSERLSKSGCFPSLVWKQRFSNYRKKRKQQKDKVS